MITILFDRGTLILETPPDTPFLSRLSSAWVWDKRIGRWRAPAIAYRELITQLYRSGTEYTDNARQYPELELKHLAPRPPHPYQSEALEAWRKTGRRGLVVLPTGSGKTYLAELAIAMVNRGTLVVAPTIDLLNQWYDCLSSAFGTEVGLVGGGYHDVRPLTITTYDSAYLYLDQFGNRFGLLVFDECHHLPGRAYSQSAEWAIAPYRLGLTATPEREDGLHTVLETLIGPCVYRRDIRQLTGQYLADYQVVTLEVDMSEEELAIYQASRATYRSVVAQNNISMSGPLGFRRFIILSSRSDEGRQAFLAYRRSRDIALAATSKLAILERLLVRHRRDRVLIFTHENKMAHQISQRFFIPTITHHTDTKERREILERFREGTYTAVATSRVLNEGVNIPSANVGIILSGSGSVREHVQRLGRLLRREGDKEAILYEVITRKTLEEHVSQRRREHSAYQ